MGSQQPQSYADNQPPHSPLGEAQSHILIVEDSADERSMYANYLARKGYRISKARDGKEGLEKAFELLPHLVVLDMWLPLISGWEVARRLKADERTHHIPIVVVTGHPSIHPRECEGWLMKPCPLDQLLSEITRILKAGGSGNKASAALGGDRTQ